MKIMVIGMLCAVALQELHALSFISRRLLDCSIYMDIYNLNNCHLQMYRTFIGMYLFIIIETDDFREQRFSSLTMDSQRELFFQKSRTFGLRRIFWAEISLLADFF